MINQSFRPLVVDPCRLRLGTVWSKLEYSLLLCTGGPSSDRARIGVYEVFWEYSSKVGRPRRCYIRGTILSEIPHYKVITNLLKPESRPVKPIDCLWKTYLMRGDTQALTPPGFWKM